MTQDVRQTNSYRPDIDGLRCLAILSVVAYHGGLPSTPGGFTGVDIFFVISGFLIGGHLFSEIRDARFRYTVFYQRRVKRILPAYFAMLIVTTILGGILLTPPELKEFARSALLSTASVSNVYFWKVTNYFNRASEHNLLLMTWSLGIEEQFYMVIPVIMVMLMRIRRSLMTPVMSILFGASFVLACLTFKRHSSFAFYMLPTRAWELGIGVMLAIAVATRPKSGLPKAATEVLSVGGLLLVSAPVFLLPTAVPFPGLVLATSVTGTVILLVSASSWINRHLLSCRPIVFVGKISYSFYLFHWSFLVFIRLVCWDHPTLKLNLLAIAASFAASTLSYYLVEQPFRNSLRAPAPLLVRYAVCTCALMICLALLLLSQGLPQRFQSLPDAVSLGSSGGLEEWMRANAASASKEVSPPSNTSKADVAIWGDSHAAALVPALSSLAASQDYGLFAFTKTACLPLVDASLVSREEPQHAADCLRFNRDSFLSIRDNQRIKVVILAGFWELPFRSSILDQGSNRWWLTREPGASSGHGVPDISASAKILQDSLRSAIVRLQAAGKNVIVMADVPNFDFDPVMRTESTQIPARRILSKWLGVQGSSDLGLAEVVRTDEVTKSAGAVESAAQGTTPVEMLDATPSLCPTMNRCFYRSGNHSFYTDSHHLSKDGAVFALGHSGLAKALRSIGQ